MPLGVHLFNWFHSLNLQDISNFAMKSFVLILLVLVSLSGFSKGPEKKYQRLYIPGSEITGKDFTKNLTCTALAIDKTWKTPPTEKEALDYVFALDKLPDLRFKNESMPLKFTYCIANNKLKSVAYSKDGKMYVKFLADQLFKFEKSRDLKNGLLLGHLGYYSEKIKEKDLAKIYLKVKGQKEVQTAFYAEVAKKYRLALK